MISNPRRRTTTFHELTCQLVRPPRWQFWSSEIPYYECDQYPNVKFEDIKINQWRTDRPVIPRIKISTDGTKESIQFRFLEQNERQQRALSCAPSHPLPGRDTRVLNCNINES